MSADRLRSDAVARIAFVPAGRPPPGAGTSLSAPLSSRRWRLAALVAPGHTGPERRQLPTPAAKAPLRATPAPAGTARAEGDANSAPRGEIRAPTRGRVRSANLRPARAPRGTPFHQAPGVPSARGASAAATRASPPPPFAPRGPAPPATRHTHGAPAPGRTPARRQGRRHAEGRRRGPPARRRHPDGVVRGPFQPLAPPRAPLEASLMISSRRGSSAVRSVTGSRRARQRRSPPRRRTRRRPARRRRRRPRRAGNSRPPPARRAGPPPACRGGPRGELRRSPS